MMNSKLNQLYLMRLFIAIVQKGSFAGAARLLNVAAAKASKDIHYLEVSLDCILLNRSTRTLNITDAGELFLQSALDIVEMHSQMLDNLAMLKNNISSIFWNPSIKIGNAKSKYAPQSVKSSTVGRSLAATPPVIVFRLTPFSPTIQPLEASATSIAKKLDVL